MCQLLWPYRCLGCCCVLFFILIHFVHWLLHYVYCPVFYWLWIMFHVCAYDFWWTSPSSRFKKNIIEWNWHTSTADDFRYTFRAIDPCFNLQNLSFKLRVFVGEITRFVDSIMSVVAWIILNPEFWWLSKQVSWLYHGHIPFFSNFTPSFHGYISYSQGPLPGISTEHLLN